jgi:HD superfamily phosphohydrolase
MEGRRAERVRAAALLHDVGHGPYSHNLEALLHRRTGKFHDDVDDLLATGEVAAVLEAHDLDPERIAGLVAGEGRLGQLVSGELDVDRMDYLVRDAHHTGVPYGTVDHDRLVRELRFVDGELALAEGNVQTAESLLLARALMNPTVYSHPVARIGKAMLRRATERLLDGGDDRASANEDGDGEAIDVENLRRMDDHDLLVALRSHDRTAADAARLGRRDLYKRAVWAELRDTPDEIVDADHATVREHEREIADSAGVDSGDVILDVPARPSMTESSSRVVVSGEIRPLGRQSTLVEALKATQRDQWRLGVYAPGDLTERVGTAAASVLGLDIDGALVSDVRPGIHATLDEFSTE